MKTKIMPAIRTLTICLMGLIGPLFPSLAATITVSSTSDSGPGSLRAALAASANGDNIGFSVTGTILLTSGELVVNKNVAISGPGAANLAVNGNYTNRVFHITNGVSVSISGLTITNGNVPLQPGTFFFGGGIMNDHSTLALSNCAVNGNSAFSGGGGICNQAYLGSASLSIFNCTLSGNTGPSGGAIYNYAPGGTGVVQIISSTLAGNSGPNTGGAINNYGIQGVATLRIINSTISGNSGGYGGAIWSDGSGGNATVAITNSTLNSNSAGNSGAIANWILYSYLGDSSANLALVNCTVSGNTAGFTSSAIQNFRALSAQFSNVASATILNCTFSGNSTAGTYGPGATLYNLQGNMVVGSSILSSDFTEPIFYNSPGTNSTITSLGYNLSTDSGAGLLTAATDQINTIPWMGPLQANGGPTLTHALLSCSPALDHGKNFGGSAGDQRGLSRIIDYPGVPAATGGDGTDIGAYEAQAFVADVTPPALVCPANQYANEIPGSGANAVSYAPAFLRDNCDPSPSVAFTPPSGSTFAVGTTPVSCSSVDASGNSNQCTFAVTVCPIIISVTTTSDSGPGSLRQAISDANNCKGLNIITFAPSANGQILLTSGELLITDELSIQGPGANLVAVDGNASKRVFHVGSNTVAGISGITITNGGAEFSGGGIWNDYGALTVSDCVITGNRVSYFGGGIYSAGDFYNTRASVTLIRTTVSGNYGGGVGSSCGVLNVTNCAFLGNSGGGIGAYASPLKVVNCWFNGNSASGGGGISANDSSLILNTTLNGNSSSYYGAGILNYGSMTVANCTLSSNVDAYAGGGGIYNAGNLILLNSTLSDNQTLGYDGGGLNNSYGNVQIGSTIFNRNLAGISGGDLFSYGGAVTSLGYNLSSDSGYWSLTDPTDQINTDPLLGPLQDNGGPTLTHAPMPCSPAIDHGRNFAGSVTDQRGAGFARIYDDPLAVNAPGSDGTDIGAVEVQLNTESPAAQVADLIVVIQGMNLKPATANALIVKLQDALALLNKGNTRGACSKLQDFINLANAQADKKEITAAQAAQLICNASRIGAVLGCR